MDLYDNRAEQVFRILRKESGLRFRSSGWLTPTAGRAGVGRAARVPAVPAGGGGRGGGPPKANGSGGGARLRGYEL
eukprot:1050777-Pyramimonas_sp.AAC.1